MDGIYEDQDTASIFFSRNHEYTSFEEMFCNILENELYI